MIDASPMLCVVAPDDNAAEQLVFDLNAHGYAVVATVEHKPRRRLATARLRGPGSIVCDLLFASSGIEHEVTERATEVEITSGLVLPVARVEELLALKVLSAVPARPLDTVDFIRVKLENMLLLCAREA